MYEEDDDGTNDKYWEDDNILKAKIEASTTLRRLVILTTISSGIDV